MPTQTPPPLTNTGTTSIILEPIEWGNNPNTVLFLGLLQTTGVSFGGTVVVTYENPQGTEETKTFNIPERTNVFSFYNIGSVTLPSGVTSASVEANIKCSTTFDILTGEQVALGSKTISNKQVPISYQNTIFCNDAGNDNDFNDFVIMAQLYNQSIE